MLDRIRSRLSYANVMATGAMFVAVMAVVVGAVSEVAASPAQGATRSACRGPADLPNFLTLPDRREISTQRVACRSALKVVRRFSERCLGAYSAQGGCEFSLGARWRCESKIVGPLSAGAPSAVSCKAKRAMVIAFKVAIFPPLPRVGPVSTSARTRTPFPGSARARATAGPFGAKCVDPSAPGAVAPPAGPPDDTFEIRTYGSVPLSLGNAVQAKLVSHNVAARLFAGLGVRPRGYPKRAPIYLWPGSRLPDGNDGISNYLCDGTGSEGAVVSTGESPEDVASTVAHELFHVYSDAVKRREKYPWFEDSAGEWSVVKAGFKTPPWDYALQYPNNALDTPTPDIYRYAMWRFVQFLDDKGLIVASDSSWPLVRGAIAGNPAEAAALDQILVSLGTNLGRELAAFWGEHLKQSPSRPPQLKPAPSHNSREIKVKAGRNMFPIKAKRLSTSLTDFKLAPDVRRVEFEFTPPADGYFWGLVAPNESRQFMSRQTVSFCVAGAHNDNLKWPGHFAVTFTNGVLTEGELTGQINVYAQTNTDQCANPDVNRACRVMRQSGAEAVLGPPVLGGFKGSSGVAMGRPYQLCLYAGMQGLGIFDLERWKSSAELRRAIGLSAKRAGWKTVNLGDTAAFYTSSSGKLASVAIAIGHDKLDVQVSNRGGAGPVVMRLARPAVRLAGSVGPAQVAGRSP